MNLRRVDLNLLVAFDALMQTRHVGRAGALLGLGQPAMSAALGRLRVLFGDDLLVRQGGAMAPTDRALQIAPEVRLLLDRIGVLVSEPEGFDAATSARHFRLRLSDLLASLLLPDLLRRIERSAPGIAIEIRHLAPEETADALERGELDLAISADLPVPKSVRDAALFPDRLSILVGPDFPDPEGLTDPTRFSATPRVRVSQSPLDDRFIDRSLKEVGLEAPVRLILPHWLLLPDALKAAPLAAIVPEAFARRLAHRHNLVEMPAPGEARDFTWSLYWHRRHDSDPAQRWLRTEISAAAADLQLPELS